MKITAEKRKVGDRKYSSGHVRVTPKLEQTYGRWEIRAKLPNSQGMWPAIWLLPNDGSWPPEIDIIELVGKEPNRVHCSFHWGPLRDGLLPWDLGQTSTDHHDAADYANTWHDFAVDWTPDAIVWYVDGVEAHRFGRTPEERAKIPNVPMYLIINNAIGGFWPRPPRRRDEVAVGHGDRFGEDLRVHGQLTRGPRRARRSTSSSTWGRRRPHRPDRGVGRLARAGGRHRRDPGVQQFDRPLVDQVQGRLGILIAGSSLATRYSRIEPSGSPGAMSCRRPPEPRPLATGLLKTP